MANLAENDKVEYTHTLMNLPNENYGVSCQSMIMHNKEMDHNLDLRAHMAILVVEFSREGYKIRKVFD